MTVDLLIFSVIENELKIILVKRGIEPFKGEWALPGGFVKINESLEEAALRELGEETGVKGVYLEQLYTFGDVGRDPRERVITVAYVALIPDKDLKLKASTDTADAQWFSVGNLPNLAFDHKKIILYALSRLKSKIEYSNIVFGLLPKKFRMSQLQRVYEAILDKKVDKRNFTKWIMSLGLIEETGERVVEGAHRPAMLYRFKSRQAVLLN